MTFSPSFWHARLPLKRLYRRVLLVVLIWPGTLVAGAGGPYRGEPELSTAMLDSLAAQGWVTGADGPSSENPRLISSALAVTLGPFGAHRLYLGTTPKVAIIYGVTFGGFGILALVDLGHLLFTKDLDRYRNSDRVFMWGGDRTKVTPP